MGDHAVEEQTVGDDKMSYTPQSCEINFTALVCIKGKVVYHQGFDAQIIIGPDSILQV